MRFVDQLELSRRALRARVCRACDWRPRSPEIISPLVPRPCEGDCPIFKNLPDLKGIARFTARESAPGQCQAIVKRVVCRHCMGSMAAADTCPVGLACECPLARYAADALDALQAIQALHTPGVAPTPATAAGRP
jgi:hypothetical protein